MDFLKDLAGSLGGAGGLDSLLKDQPQLAQAAREFLGSDSDLGPSGGLQDILGQLQSSGLGDAVSSWLSSGENRGLSPEQLMGALDNDVLRQFAARAGIDLDQAAAALSQLLPQLVDRLSPNGELQAGAGQGLNQMLGSLLGGTRPA